MAVTLASVQTDAKLIYGEASGTTNGIFTDNFCIMAHNRFLDEYELEMELEIDPTSYTWAASTTAVALSSISSTMISIQKIEVLDDDSDYDYDILPLPRGSNEGFYLWNDKVWLNGDTSGPTEAISMVLLGFRKGTRVSATSSNVDIHSGSERAVMTPYLLYLGSLRAKKFAAAEGFRKEFEVAFDGMKRKRSQQANPQFESWTVSDGYGPLTG